MHPIRHLSLRKSIAVSAAIAALAAPAGAAAWPIIGDDPTQAAAQTAGHDWMDARRARLARTRHPVAKPQSKPPRLCPKKTDGASCVKR